MAVTLPSADIFARRRYLTAPVLISLSAVTAKSAALSAGNIYDLYASVPWFFQQGDQSTITAALTSIPLQAWQPTEIYVSGAGDTGIAGILASGTGTAYIVRRD